MPRSMITQTRYEHVAATTNAAHERGTTCGNRSERRNAVGIDMRRIPTSAPATTHRQLRHPGQPMAAENYAVAVTGAPARPSTGLRPVAPRAQPPHPPLVCPLREMGERHEHRDPDERPGTVGKPRHRRQGNERCQQEAGDEHEHPRARAPEDVFAFHGGRAGLPPDGARA